MYHIKKYWFVILLAFIVILGVKFFSSNTKTETDHVPEWEQVVEAEESNQPNLNQDVTTSMFVDIKGEVMMPGVYEVDATSRVLDLIKLAGGFTANAEQNAINLAQKLKDEMVIYVPAVGEETSLQVSEQEDGLININEADQSELETLPGIGPSKAAAIIAYREENGPFQSIDDLGNVSGIGEKSLEKLRDLIRIQ
ncbi:helix-hairpin-helix domain-containing protein [Bacillus pinisoli]|uniref:helix-hairpin-helix domain-containing protein n=1 Tax=Bacillus pinisoli TaxID=2901866 RepID=UPI001FF473F2|nr:helix-hairpin-helix domain-containing protein [Bacillus pinisoli]